MISNLVSNAIKYNKEDGHVYVHIYSKEDNMVIEVKDTGIGIPLADRGRVFERFYRVDKGRSRIKGGTGLGLAIVKHIVSYNKGTVKLHSQLEKVLVLQLLFLLNHRDASASLYFLKLRYIYYKLNTV